MHSFLEALTTLNLNDSFPIVEIVLKLFVSILCSNASEKKILLKIFKLIFLNFKNSRELPENIII
jgi:hypothetical protein